MTIDTLDQLEICKMNSRRAGITLLQCLLIIVFIALVLGLTRSVVRGPLARRGQLTHVQHLAFSPDGRILAAASWNRPLRLWDVTTGHEREAYKFQSYSMAFSPDGKTLALGCRDGMVTLWDVAGEKEQAVLGGPPTKQLYPPYVSALAFHPNGVILATGSYDSKVRLLNVTTGEELAAFRGHVYSIDHLVYSNDGKRLATASHTTSSGVKRVRLWDGETGEELAASEQESDILIAMGPGPAGKILAVGEVSYNANGGVSNPSRINRTTIWDVESGEEWIANKFHGFGPGAFSPDGNYLAVANGDEPVRVGDLIARKDMPILSGHTNKTWSLAFSPDRKTLATGHDLGTVRLWDVATGRQRTVLIGEDQVSWILFGSGFLAWALAWWKLKPKKSKSGRVDRTTQVAI